MKKIIVALVTAITFAMPQANAGWTDSFYFEPTLFCVVGAGGGYLAANKGDEVLTAGVGCLVGFGLGYLINSYYGNKIGAMYKEEIKDYKTSIREFEVLQAQKASLGEDDQFSIRVQEIVPGRKNSDGSISSPYIRERLVMPGEGNRLGD